MGGKVTGVTPDEMQSVVSGYVGQHIELVARSAKVDIEEVAEETANYLKATSPVDKNSKGRHYKNGWRSKAFVGSTITGRTAAIVYNATKPGLTHLLEHGHGGPAPAAAKPHIEAAFERAKERMDRKLS